MFWSQLAKCMKSASELQDVVVIHERRSNCEISDDLSYGFDSIAPARTLSPTWLPTTPLSSACWLHIGWIDRLNGTVVTAQSDIDIDALCRLDLINSYRLRLAKRPTLLTLFSLTFLQSRCRFTLIRILQSCIFTRAFLSHLVRSRNFSVAIIKNSSSSVDFNNDSLLNSRPSMTVIWSLWSQAFNVIKVTQCHWQWRYSIGRYDSRCYQPIATISPSCPVSDTLWLNSLSNLARVVQRELRPTTLPQ